MSELIAVLPAAGRGTRLGPTPSSKEILPLGFDRGPHRREMDKLSALAAWRPVTTIESHLHAFHRAGVSRVVVVLGPGKFDVMEYLGSGSRFGLRISYLFQEELRGMPFALDLARPWSRAATTLFAMPDTLVEPQDAMAQLSRKHQGSGADLTLGLFETDNPAKFGMVRRNAGGRIEAFVDKPEKTDLRMMWGMAAWSPAFTEFMGEALQRVVPGGPETVLSDIFAAALHAGLRVEGVALPGARYSDIGTPEEFQQVVHRLANATHADLTQTAGVHGSATPDAVLRSDGTPVFAPAMQSDVESAIKPAVRYGIEPVVQPGPELQAD